MKRVRLHPLRLEDRLAPAVVTNTNDSGSGSLRDAVAVGGTVTFDSVVFATPQTINLTSGRLPINSPVTIVGPGSGLLSVSSTSGIAFVQKSSTPGGPNGSLGVSGVRIAGWSGSGISISRGSVGLTNCVVDGSASSGAAIFSSSLAGAISVNSCQFTGSAAFVDGYEAATSVSGCTFTGVSGFAVRVSNLSSGLGVGGCTFTNCGGGVGSGATFSFGSSLGVNNCTFTGCGTGLALSPAFLATTANAVISGCTFSKNGTGANLATSSNATIRLSGCQFSGNSTAFQAGPYGSGLVGLTDCTISNSKSRAVDVRSFAKFDMTGCQLVTNAAGVVFQGGDGAITVTNSTIAGSSLAAISLAGPTALDFLTLAIVGSTISGNGTGITRVGGGGKMTVTNSTISGNKQSGITLTTLSGSDSVTVQNSTITANGVGISRGGGTGSITLSSTIVAQNKAAGSAPDLAFNSLSNVSGNNNLIGVADQGNVTLTGTGNLTGTSAAPLDARLAPLANNGGLTLTHALRAGSPAFDAGNNAAGLGLDQRLFARVIGPAADIGSLESNPLPPVVLAVQVNDGSPQRSMVTQLKVTFSESVTFPAGLAAAFQLQRTGPGGPTGPVNLNLVQAGASVTITFPGGGTVGTDPAGSLADGAYQLAVVAAKIQGGAGNLDGNGDGIGADDYESPTTPGSPGRIFRQFGDADGDADVDGADFAAFRGAIGGGTVLFDFDGNGVVNVTDFEQFRARFGSSI